MTPAEINEAVTKKLGWEPKRLHRCGALGCDSEVEEKAPNYCGSIQAAFELLSHFDYLEITKGEKTDWLVKSGAPECSYAKTLPEAICLAFLRL